MSELKADLDLSFLLDAGFLRQCAFDRFQVTLLFEHMEIDIRSPCEVTSPDGYTWFFDTGKTYDMSVLTYLLDSDIVAYRIVPGQRLILSFSNHLGLALIDHNKGYESFIIRKSDNSILIVV